jgi:hypothetical protein
VQAVPSQQGTIEFPFELAPYEVLYLELRPAEAAAIAEVSAEFALWDQIMGEKSR